MTTLEAVKLHYVTCNGGRDFYKWAFFFRFSDGFSVSAEILKDEVSPADYACIFRAMADTVERYYADKETKACET